MRGQEVEENKFDFERRTLTESERLYSDSWSKIEIEWETENR